MFLEKSYISQKYLKHNFSSKFMVILNKDILIKTLPAWARDSNPRLSDSAPCAPKLQVFLENQNNGGEASFFEKMPKDKISPISMKMSPRK